MVVVFHNILSFMTGLKNVTTSIFGNLYRFKGSPIFQKPCIIELSKSVETFFIVSISDVPTIKYWQNLGKTMKKAKEMIPKEFRIGDTCFTSFATIGGNLYTRNANNINHVHNTQ